MDTDHANNEDEQDLDALAQRLAAWRPSAGALDRDQMLYDAGHAAAGAEARVRTWRLATAALAIVTVGLSGLLVHQRSLLGHERFALAQERSRLEALGTALASRSEASKPSPSALKAAAAPFEPLPQTSYFAMASRLSKGIEDPSSPDFQSQAGSHRPDPLRPEVMRQPAPLRSRDVERVLDL